jgi:hypothetical protein
LLKKYSIHPENCIALYYRGTDKATELELDSFDSYYLKLNEVLEKEKDLQVILQSDSAQFIEYMKGKSLNNSIIIEELSRSYTAHGIHNEKSKDENFIDIHFFFAVVLILSKCKYIVCSSGNCSLWMMYYRGNAKNIHQNLNKVWL